MAASKATGSDLADMPNSGDVPLIGEIMTTKSDPLADLTAFLLKEGIQTEPDPATIARAIMGEATIDGGDPDLAGKAIVARLLMADTVEDVLTQNNVTGAEMVLNANMEVRGVKWMPSAYEKGPKVYALMDVVDLITGQARLISCGSANVLAQLLRIQVGNGFPVDVKIVQSQRATAAGNYPMWLEKADPRPAQTQAPF